MGCAAISDGIVQEPVAVHQDSLTLADPLFHPGVGPVCLRCNLRPSPVALVFPFPKSAAGFMSSDSLEFA